MKKLCPRCKIEKELDQFYPDPRYKLGVQSYCRVCKHKGALVSQKKKRLQSSSRRLVCRSSRKPEDNWNRLEWRRLQRSLAHLDIESREQELARLIEEQSRDDKEFRVNKNFAFDSTHPYKDVPHGTLVIWDEYYLAKQR